MRHRIGRTARFGKRGAAVQIYLPAQQPLIDTVSRYDSALDALARVLIARVLSLAVSHVRACLSRVCLQMETKFSLTPLDPDDEELCGEALEQATVEQLVAQ